MKFMSNKVFIDSNVWLYAAMENGDNKSILAKQVIEQNNVVISTQVINEISFNLLRKYRYTEEELISFINNIKTYCQISHLDIQTCLTASLLRQRYALSFWDSLIVSSALETKCTILYSEDMQHQQIIEQQIVILNPFK